MKTSMNLNRRIAAAAAAGATGAVLAVLPAPPASAGDGLSITGSCGYYGTRISAYGTGAFPRDRPTHTFSGKLYTSSGRFLLGASDSTVDAVDPTTDYINVALNTPVTGSGHYVIFRLVVGSNTLSKRVNCG
jgi:hypothetical protein